MRLLVRPLVALALAATTLSCASDATTSTETTAEQLNGRWSDPNGSFGYSFIMTLGTEGSTVTGVGFFSYEAGPVGSLVVHGTVSGKTVDLDITYSTGEIRHFRGEIEMFTLLKGTWWSVPSGDPVPFTLKRTVPPPGVTPL